MFNLNIESYLNSKGLTTSSTFQKGNLTPSGSSIPWSGVEHITSTKSGLRYKIYSEYKNDNIECLGQTIKTSLEKFCIEEIGIAGLGIYGGYRDTIQVTREDNSLLTLPIKFSSFLKNDVCYKGNHKLYEEYDFIYNKNVYEIPNQVGLIWECFLKLEYPMKVKSIQLPINPCIHIFSITCR